MAQNLASTTETIANATGTSLVDDLSKIGIFADLPREQLDWLAEHLQVLHFQPGEITGREGEPLDHLVIILEGELRIQRGSGSDEIIIRVTAGQVTGRERDTEENKALGIVRVGRAWICLLFVFPRGAGQTIP